MLPQDPMILLSFVNMKLRDEYPDLDELCDSLNLDRDELLKRMEKAGYHYDEENRCFK